MPLRDLLAEVARVLDDEHLEPIKHRLHELEKRMTSAESAQDALNEQVTQLNTDVQAVADELAAVIQQNQSGQLTADQVNAALGPIHQKLAGLVVANPTDPTTTTDPTNSPAPDPIANPAPDAPPVTSDPTSVPVAGGNGVTVVPNDPTPQPPVATANTNDFREDV